MISNIKGRLILLITFVALGVVGFGLFSLSATTGHSQAVSSVVTASPTTTNTATPTVTSVTGSDYIYQYANVKVDSPLVKEAATRGAITFRAWCNSCHPNGQEGYGPTLWGNNAVMSPAAIFQRVRASDERERARFSQLSPDKLNDIIAYIQAQERAANGN